MTRQAKPSAVYNASPFPRRNQKELDVEKASYYRRSIESDTDDDTPISDTSHVTAASQKPMLGGPSLRRSRLGIGFYRVPHRIMRWMCLALFSALILFIVTLFRFSLPSPMEKVALELPKPKAKPPQWESFPFLTRYHGGIRTLVSRKNNVPEYPGETFEAIADQVTDEDANETLSARDPEALKFKSSEYNPYPNYTSEAYIKRYGVKKDCFLDEEGTVRVPYVHYYKGIPRGFPDAVMGSNEMLGIQDNICFERFGRLGPYGMGYGAKRGGIGAGMEGHREGAERVWEDYPPVDFRDVDWAAAQSRCVVANNHRFKELPPPRVDRFLSMPVGAPASPVEPETKNIKDTKDAEDTNSVKDTSSSKDAKRENVKKDERLPRTAVIIRTWWDFKYTPEDILYLRSLISELSLQSGGEYVVHFLVHVKDDNVQIWSDDETYQRVLEKALPEEFRGMGVLWSERQMGLLYAGLEDSFMRGLPVHGVYRSTFMPMQYFAYQHPEYDYYWNWEMDVRYTGHWYHFFDKVAHWAKEQPRKGLWERNARFYVPSVHGPWEDFRQMVRVQTEHGTNSPNNMWSPLKSDKNEIVKASVQKGDRPIWGPERPAERDIMEVEGEGIPPTTYEKDRYEWGVGEDADLIVFNPMYDPEGTTWLLRDDVTGYDISNGRPPRRTAIITASRLSRKLLLTMHRETSLKHHTMFSEMWPATTCLHHGFKAVYVPHSVYIDRRWPTQYLESVFNAGRNGASGGARTAVFGDREHNFRGTTWFYSAGFSPNLWKRWLGYRVDNDGGEEEELANEGRMCLPPMLLHPVKNVDMIIDDGSMVVVDDESVQNEA